MLEHALLGGPVVIRHHLQRRIRADAFGKTGQLNGLSSRITTGAGNDWNPAGHMGNGGLDQLTMLFHRHRRRFARGAHDHDGIGAFGNMPVNQLTQRWHIQTAVVVHRGHYRNYAALDHG